MIINWTFDFDVHFIYWIFRCATKYNYRTLCTNLKDKFKQIYKRKQKEHNKTYLCLYKKNISCFNYLVIKRSFPLIIAKLANVLQCVSLYTYTCTAIIQFYRWITFEWKKLRTSGQKSAKWSCWTTTRVPIAWWYVIVKKATVGKYYE